MHIIPWGFWQESIAAFSNAFSMSYDGVDEDFTGGNIHNFERTDSFTFIVRIKLNQTASTQVFLGKLNNVSPFNGYLFYVSTNKLTFILRNSGSNALEIQSTSTNFTADEWITLGLTYGGTSTPAGSKLFVNGLVEPQTTLVDNLSASTLTSIDFTLGSRNGANFFLDGLMDEPVILNSALSEAQMLDIYNGGDPEDLSPFNPNGWWRKGDGDIFTSGNWELTDNGSDGNLLTSRNIEEGGRSTDVPT